MQQKYIADKLKRLEENEGRIENKRQRKQYSDISEMVKRK
jgi:hypothetical protein